MKDTTKRADVARVFFEVKKILMSNMRRNFENLGLTLPQSLVIHTLLEFGEMKISELSSRINLSNSTISGIVDRLERQQLVERTRSQEDRRIVNVRVTPKVAELHQGIHRKLEEGFEDLLSAGTPEEIEVIINGLNTLKKILQTTCQ